MLKSRMINQFEEVLRIGLFLGLGAILGVSLTACRVGNSVQNLTPPDASASADHTTGYYLAEPSDLKLLITTTNTANQSVSTDFIPPEIQQYISNPVALIMNDPADSGDALFVSAKAIAQGGKLSGLPIHVGTDDSLKFKGNTQSEVFWIDPNCLSWSDWILSGKLVRDTKLSAPTGSKVTVLGAIELNIQLIYHFEGDCKPTFQTLTSCYSDASQCGAKTQSDNSQLHLYVSQLFDPFIDANLISLDQIPNITNFAYEVSYR